MGKGEMCMSIQAYRDWMTAREYNTGTIEKYIRDLNRFFRETGAQKKPDKQTVAAWRDSLVARGYAASSVNAMLAAVNGYQEFCENPGGKAKPLKCQRRIFCDAGRELDRGEYFRLLETARLTGRPLDRITVWKEMKALCKQAGVAPKKVFPHNLRHLFARTFYGIEKNLSKLADLLGHSSIETTRIYIMESGAEHQRLLERMYLLL